MAALTTGRFLVPSLSKVARTTLMMAGGLLLLAGCSPLALLDGLTPRDGYEAERGIAYGREPRQKLDIYRPETGVDPAKPVLVFFYGGAWKTGDRQSYRFIGQSFAKAGYVTVVSDYRLYPGVSFPAFVEDGAAAVAWVAEHIPHADGRIVVMGHSAGAYIAAMLACDGRYLVEAGTSRRSLAGFVGLAGPYSFTPDGENALILANPDGRPNMPTATVDGGEPPTLLIVAKNDDVVWTSNTDKLAAKLTAAQVPVTVKAYDDIDHARLVATLGTTLSGWAPARSDVLSFLKNRTP